MTRRVVSQGQEKQSEARIKGYMTMMDSMTDDELDGIDKNKNKAAAPLIATTCPPVQAQLSIICSLERADWLWGGVSIGLTS